MNILKANMLYPISPLMTREELMQFDVLRYLNTHTNTLQDRMIANIKQQSKLTVQLQNVKRRHVAALNTQRDIDPNDQRLMKDAVTETTNCTKQIDRLMANLNDLHASDQCTRNTYQELDEQAFLIREQYPVAAEAILRLYLEKPCH